MPVSYAIVGCEEHTVALLPVLFFEAISGRQNGAYAKLAFLW
jgi:hypothetical protein